MYNSQELSVFSANYTLVVHMNQWLYYHYDFKINIWNLYLSLKTQKLAVLGLWRRKNMREILSVTSMHCLFAVMNIKHHGFSDSLTLRQREIWFPMNFSLRVPQACLRCLSLFSVCPVSQYYDKNVKNNQIWKITP